MDQLHPLRDVYYHDIFPILKYLETPEAEESRKTMIKIKKQEE